MKKSFSERLEHLRGDRSQREFAKKIGVPLTSYTNWVLGVSQPKFDNLVSICSTLGVSADWLLGLPTASSPSIPSAPVVPPDAASAPSEAYWRDLAASQQETIAGLTASNTSAYCRRRANASHNICLTCTEGVRLKQLLDTEHSRYSMQV